MLLQAGDSSRPFLTGRRLRFASGRFQRASGGKISSANLDCLTPHPTEGRTRGRTSERTGGRRRREGGTQSRGNRRQPKLAHARFWVRARNGNERRHFSPAPQVFDGKREFRLIAVCDMVKLSDRFNSTRNGVTLTSVVPMESGEKGGFGGGWRNRMIDSLDPPPYDPDKMGLSRFGSH